MRDMGLEQGSMYTVMVATSIVLPSSETAAAFHCPSIVYTAMDGAKGVVAWSTSRSGTVPSRADVAAPNGWHAPPPEASSDGGEN